MGIRTRAATDADVTAISAVLAEAFADDPVMAAIWPNDAHRYRLLPRYFAVSLRHFHLPGGGVRVATDRDGHIGAVAVWDPPGSQAGSTARTVRALPDLLPILGRRAGAGLAVRRAIDARRPSSPPEHWYLAHLASPLSHRGQGYARTLLTSSVERPAWLVCTRETTIPYYERAGFSVAESFHLPAGARPPVWAMVRRT
ncbi:MULTISPECIES: N-acetyltransferase [unclassified Nocardia]|uniref:N-acetyltransferase n=1 Tax=unclassified Nocardia TaxID=2637762 RepID=UPI00278BBF55|nr:MULTISPECIES: N-acetyltransferase [unclassified Nocardia]